MICAGVAACLQRGRKEKSCVAGGPTWHKDPSPPKATAEELLRAAVLYDIRLRIQARGCNEVST